MTHLLRYIFLLLLVSSAASCSQFTYRPHARRQQQRAKPPVPLLEQIIVYRMLYNSWPATKEQFTARDERFKAVFQGFPYQYVRFQEKGPEEMIFYFSGHTADEQAYRQSGLIDLNSYNSSVRFYREGNRWLWKIKMH